MIEDNINYTYVITSVDDLGGDLYKLNSCDTMHLTVGKVVTIDAVEYTITDFVLNSYVTVSGSTPVTATEFEAYPFFFFNGSLSDTNIERFGAKQYQLNQIPFMWNRTPYTSDELDTENGSNIAEINSLTWYLLDASRPFANGDGANSSWFDEEFNTYIIEPLKNFWEKRVKKYIDTNQQIFGEYTGVNVRNLPHIGQEDEKGTYEALFDEHLTGIEVRLNLEFMFQGCEC